MFKLFLNLVPITYFRPFIPWICMICSALLYVSSFTWWGFLALFYLAPFFYVAAWRTIRFVHCFFWLILAYALLLYPFISDLCLLSNGTWWQTIVPPLFFYFYLVSVSALFFFCSCTAINKLSAHHDVLKVTSWSATWIIYWWLVDTYCLSIFLRVEGFPFLSPLLPLTEYPWLLSVVSSFGMMGGHMLSILYGYMVSTLVDKKNMPALYTTCIIGILQGYTYHMHTNTEQPPWINAVYHVPMTLTSLRKDHCVTWLVMQRIYSIMKNKTKPTLFLFPESALDGVISMDQKYFTHASDKQSNITVCAGAHTRNNKQYCNVALLFNDHGIYDIYHKKLAMLLIEQLPKWASWNWLQSAYLYQACGITTEIRHGQTHQLPPIGTVALYLCSDFFLQQSRPHNASILVVLVNDSWIHKRYIARTLCNIAQLRAVAWQCTILYVSYHYGCCFLPSGESITLHSIANC